MDIHDEARDGAMQLAVAITDIKWEMAALEQELKEHYKDYLAITEELPRNEWAAITPPGHRVEKIVPTKLAPKKSLVEWLKAHGGSGCVETRTIEEVNEDKLEEAIRNRTVDIDGVKEHMTQKKPYIRVVWAKED